MDEQIKYVCFSIWILLFSLLSLLRFSFNIPFCSILRNRNDWNSPHIRQKFKLNQYICFEPEHTRSQSLSLFLCRYFHKSKSWKQPKLKSNNADYVRKTVKWTPKARLQPTANGDILKIKIVCNTLFFSFVRLLFCFQWYYTLNVSFATIHCHKWPVLSGRFCSFVLCTRDFCL